MKEEKVSIDSFKRAFQERRGLEFWLEEKVVSNEGTIENRNCGRIFVWFLELSVGGKIDKSEKGRRVFK